MSKSLTVGELVHQLTTLMLEDKKAANLPIDVCVAYFHNGDPCGNPVKGILVRRGMRHGKREKYVVIE